jgi:RimJ/RimL family protein N-acetyltransferase
VAQSPVSSDIEIRSRRLVLRPFTAADAKDVFACITPSITRFMAWEPPPSRAAFAQVWQSWLPSIIDGSNLYLVVRSTEGRCLGIVGLHGAQTKSPELGIWLREDAHGQGLGREAVSAVVAWASSTLSPEYFEYPVAEQNLASERIAQSLGGVATGRRPNPKYTAIVYRVPKAAH